MYGNIQVRFLRGKEAERLPTYLTRKVRDFMKVSKIICPKCKNTEFKAGNDKYTCESCNYILSDEDIDRILNEAYKQHKAELNQKKEKPRDGIKEIEKVCIAVMKLKDSDFVTTEAMYTEQLEYTHPFKHGTANRQHRLGEHNRKVIEALKNLREVISAGGNI